MKYISFFVVLLIGPLLSWSQNCTYGGDEDRWDARFAYPGVKSGNVQAMIAGKDGYLYLGGGYTAAYGGDTEYNNLVRYDGIKYEELGGGLQCTSCGTGNIYAMTQDDMGNIYIGGFFQRAVQSDGTVIQTKNVAKWNIFTEQWEALGIGLGNDQVNVLVWHNDTLFAGGRFDDAYNTSDTLAVNSIAYYVSSANRWEALGSGVSSTGSGSTDGSVRALAVGTDGTLYAGGAFDNASGLAINSVARWTRLGGWDNWNGGLVQTTGSGSSPAICEELAYDEVTGDLYALGTFGNYTASASVADVRQFARWNANTQAWSLIQGFGKPSGFSAWTMRAMHLDSTSRQLYIGGSFNIYQTQFPANLPAGNRIVAYNLNNQTFSQLGAGILNGVGPAAIEIYQGKVFAGGSFSQLTGQKAYNLAAYDSSGWDNLGDGISGSSGGIEAMLAYGDTIIAGGNFSEIDGLSFERLARYDDASGWKGIDLGLFSGSVSNFNKLIYSLELVGDELWVGGFFAGLDDTINSVSIGRINLKTGQISGVGTGVGGSFPRVIAIQEFQGDVYIAGRFTSVDGISTTDIARYRNGAWEVVADFGSGGNLVSSFYNDGDSALYIGGRFSSVNGNTDMSRMVKYDGSHFRSLGQGITGVNNSATAITMDKNGMLHVGGFISQTKQSDGSILNTGGSRNLIQWYQGQWIDSTQLDLGTGSNAIRSLMVDSSNTLYFGGQFNEYNGFSDNHIGRWNPNAGYLGFGGGITLSSIGSVTNPVMSMVMLDSLLYLAGKINRVGNRQSQGFARYRLENSLPGAFMVDLGQDFSSCDMAQLQVDQGFTYQWNTGETTSGIVVDSSGIYSVKVTDSFGCVDEDSIQVEILEAREDIFGADTLSFTGMDTTIVLPSGLSDISWSDGDSAESKTFFDGGPYEVSFVDTNGCAGSDNFYLIQEIGTHIQQSLSSSIKLYPNPAKDQLNIELSEAIALRVRLFSLSGKELLRINEQASTLNLDISSLTSGIYFLEIETDKGTHRIKVLKQ